MSAPEQAPEAPRADHDLIRAALAPYEGLAGQVGIWILHEVGGRSESHRYGTSSDELDRAARDAIKADAVDEPVGIYLRGTTVDPEAGGRGGADDSVTWIHIRADLDLGKPHGPRNWRELFDAFSRARLPEPTDWQHSGGGFYPRWQLAAPVADSAEIRLVAKRIERELVTAWREAGFTQGVDACADAARVWRLTGTVHRKDREHPVSSTTGKSSGRVYTPAELVADLPEPTPERVAATGPGTGGAEHERRTYTPGQAERVLTRALARVRESVYPGNVNTTLNESAMTIGHLAAEYLGWDADDALERACALIEPALLAGPGRRAGWTGLDRTDRGTIRSGLSAGMARPDRIVAAPVMPLLVADGPCEDGYVLDGLTEHWDGHGPTARLRTGEDPAQATDDAAAVSAAYEHDQAAERALTVELGSAAEARALLTERRRREARRALDAEERGGREPLRLTWDDDLEDVTPPPMLLPELLPGRAMGWLGGPSGSYKSFVAVSLAVSLAHGIGALGDGDLTPGAPVKVLYVASEDPLGVKWRVRALRHHLGIQGRDGRLAITDRAVNIADQYALDELVAQVQAEGVEFLVIDTFRQSTPGVNENDNGEVGLVLSYMARLRDEHEIGSLIVDHTNKSAIGMADLGGAGIKRANADYVLMVDLPNGAREVEAQRTLRVAKMKNKGDGRTWPIRLERVPEVVDSEGDAAAVAVIGEVEPVEGGSIHGDDDWREVELPEDIRRYEGSGRESLGIVAQMVIRYGSGDSGVSRSEVVGHYRAARPEVSRNAANKRVAKAWDALHELGRLAPIGTGGSMINHHRWVPKQS